MWNSRSEPHPSHGKTRALPPSTCSPGFSSDMSSLMGSLESLQDVISDDTDTNDGEEIVFVDLKTGHKVKGIAKASLNGVFLVGGSEIKLQFVSDEE